MSTDDKTRIVSASGGVGPGTQLNGIFEIDEHIAFGGMGEVYRGHNIQTDDPVAIKIVLPEFARDKTMLALFRKEASILSHLGNDAIVRYHVFTIDPAIGRPYLAMEYVDGVSLADLITRGPMEAETVRRLIARIASGLSAAHAAGVIHRDLSPDNVILPGGKVEKAKIIDFGIAKSASVGGGTLLGGKFAGKYNFVSPEQLGDFGGEITNRSDVYSLGLVMAAALRGEVLDMGGSQVDVIEKRRKMPDISNLDPTLLPILEAMLQPDPDNRPSSMDAVVQWLSGPVQALPGMPRYGDQDTAQPTYLPGDNPAWQNLPVPGERSAAPSGSTPPLSGGSVRPTSVVPGAAASFGSVPPAGSIPPLSRSGSAAPVSESPFGAFRPQAPAPAWTPPPAHQQSAPAKKSRAALYAATAVVLVALVGGAAYMSGMLDSPSATSTDAPAEPPTLEARTDVAPPLSKPADTASAPAETTPPPAAEASAQPEAPPPAAAASTEAPAVAPTSTEVEAKAEPPPAAEAPKEEAKAEAPPPSEPAESDAPAEEKVAVIVPEVSPPPPPPTLETAATRVAWLNDYGGGDCFYATATSATDNAIEIEGFGTSVASFETMLAEFKKTHKIEPEIGVRLIEQKQCAVADFLQALRNSPADRPLLTLSSAMIKSGQALRGTLGNLEGRKTDVLLVDNAGVVYNLASHLKQAKEKASFNIKLGLATEAPVPQLIIALTSPKGLDTAKVENPVLAETLFPKILEEINSKKVAASATAKYFKLGG